MIDDCLFVLFLFVGVAKTYPRPFVLTLASAAGRDTRAAERCVHPRQVTDRPESKSRLGSFRSLTHLSCCNKQTSRQPPPRPRKPQNRNRPTHLTHTRSKPLVANTARHCSMRVRRRRRSGTTRPRSRCIDPRNLLLFLCRWFCAIRCCCVRSSLTVGR
jgi:hypothetical protein